MFFNSTTSILNFCLYYCLVPCDALQFGRQFETFRGICCLNLKIILKKEGADTPETLAQMYQTI